MAKWEVKGGVATPADVTALIARAQDLADLQEKMDQANRPESHRPMINCLRACAAALADATRIKEAAEDRVAELTVENERLGELFDDLCYFPTPEGKASHLAKMVAQSQARVAELTANLEAVREALRPFADIGIGSDPDYQPTIRMDRAAIVAARVAVEMDGASMPDKINWRYDPAAIVEEDEPMIRRDYE